MTYVENCTYWGPGNASGEMLYITGFECNKLVLLQQFHAEEEMEIIFLREEEEIRILPQIQ
jgi:hypothetical protein